jgi:hypothetical protein
MYPLKKLSLHLSFPNFRHVLFYTYLESTKTLEFLELKVSNDDRVFERFELIMSSLINATTIKTVKLNEAFRCYYIE